MPRNVLIWLHVDWLLQRFVLFKCELFLVNLHPPRECLVSVHR